LFKPYKILKKLSLSRAVLPHQFCFEKSQFIGILHFLAVMIGINIGKGGLRKCF
jgi:hypothetical protein